MYPLLITQRKALIVLSILSVQTKALELPKEHEMPARDKYTVFSPHEKGYRKGIHKVPKWTRVSTMLLSVSTSSVH